MLNGWGERTEWNSWQELQGAEWGTKIGKETSWWINCLLWADVQLQVSCKWGDTAPGREQHWPGWDTTWESIQSPEKEEKFPNWDLHDCLFGKSKFVRKYKNYSIHGFPCCLILRQTSAYLSLLVYVCLGITRQDTPVSKAWGVSSEPFAQGTGPFYAPELKAKGSGCSSSSPFHYAGATILHGRREWTSKQCEPWHQEEKQQQQLLINSPAHLSLWTAVEKTPR